MALLPAPVCELGYTQAELEQILGDRFDQFDLWMTGQTVAWCDGRQYNYETKEYEPTNCGPHGMVVYPWDLQGFLNNAPVFD